MTVSPKGVLFSDYFGYMSCGKYLFLLVLDKCAQFFLKEQVGNFFVKRFM